MKTKQRIYFICIMIGVLLLAFGNTVIQNVYLQSSGFILLMLGIYKTSRIRTTSPEIQERELTEKHHEQS
ncbi:hypothetical protein WIW50_16590 [Flavobacteriaceae bacterium 3-367]|uniref:hypothetical protein n=1 Tax=Eudoraea algarum TaxID=3417568 RepID=UPI0032894977